jgi:hypothetical protein
VHGRREQGSRPHSLEARGVPQPDGPPVGDDDPLVAPGLKDAVDRLAGEPDELAQVPLTQAQRDQHAIAVLDAVLPGEIEQRVGQPRAGALAQEFFDPAAEPPQPGRGSSSAR